MADGGSVPGPMRVAASSTPFIGARALGRGSRYGTRVVRSMTANGSPGAAWCAYGDVRGRAGEVWRCGHWLGGGEVGLLGLRRCDAWRRGFGCERRCEAWDRRSPRGTGVRARSVGGATNTAWRARRRAWARAGAVQISNGPVQMQISPNFPTKVHQGVNRKVVDLVFLYNFCKGRRVFFSTTFAQFAGQDH
jgi:hypothetical protein